MNALLALLKRVLHNMLQLFSFGRKTISNTLSICIKTNTGSTLNVDLNPKWDIGNVKRLVADELGLNADELKIIFAGRELHNSTTIEECDLGQRSVLHAVRSRSAADQPQRRPRNAGKQALNAAIAEADDEDEPSGARPLAATLIDLQLDGSERSRIHSDAERQRQLAHFFVHCTQCARLCAGKLRVRCARCDGGAFTVYRDPECWDDVLLAGRIAGHCDSNERRPCFDATTGGPPMARFYFKCASHASEGERDFAVPLNLVKHNGNGVPCLACMDVADTVLVFPCAARHVTCVECFRGYCRSRLLERRFVELADGGYTLDCPAGCAESAIREVHHFRLLAGDEYERYQRFATEEFVLRAGGVLCPQPGCGMGLLVDEGCTRVQCQQGCGFVFCRLCLKGFHMGECQPDEQPVADRVASEYAVDPGRAATARWDEATAVTIRVCTKPCPKCRTPTERSGGCMHMVCTRSGCGLEWCWVCQCEWTRDCMGAHWFG